MGPGVVAATVRHAVDRSVANMLDRSGGRARLPDGGRTRPLLLWVVPFLVLSVLLSGCGSGPGTGTGRSDAGQGFSFQPFPSLTASHPIQVPQDVATITEAVAAAHDGDTIMVAGGTYAESVVITQNNFQLVGTGAVVIRPPSGLPGIQVASGVSNVRIANVTVQVSASSQAPLGPGLSARPAGAEQAPAAVTASANQLAQFLASIVLVLEPEAVEAPKNVGVQIGGASASTTAIVLDGVTIDAGGRLAALLAIKCQGLTATSCTVANGQIGYFDASGRGSLVRGCSLSSCPVGVLMEHGQADRVSGCTIDTTVGLVTQFGGQGNSVDACAFGSRQPCQQGIEMFGEQADHVSGCSIAATAAPGSAGADVGISVFFSSVVISGNNRITAGNASAPGVGVSCTGLSNTLFPCVISDNTIDVTGRFPDINSIGIDTELVQATVQGNMVTSTGDFSTGVFDQGNGNPASSTDAISDNIIHVSGTGVNGILVLSRSVKIQRNNVSATGYASLGMLLEPLSNNAYTCSISSNTIVASGHNTNAIVAGDRLGKGRLTGAITQNAISFSATDVSSTVGIAFNPNFNGNIVGNRIQAKGGFSFGIFQLGATTEIANNLVLHCSIGILLSASPAAPTSFIHNNTIFLTPIDSVPSGSFGRGMFFSTRTVAIAEGNLIVGNNAANYQGIRIQGSSLSAPTASVTEDHNDVFNCQGPFRNDQGSYAPALTDLQQDPGFQDTTTFKLSVGSPCIDAGPSDPISPTLQTLLGLIYTSSVVGTAETTLNDQVPPGLGTAHNDIGAYGGPLAVPDLPSPVP